MAIEYSLTLATDTSTEVVAECVALAPDECGVFDPDECQRPSGPRMVLSANLYERYGFWLSVLAGRHGYHGFDDEEGNPWEWEPTAYVCVSFRLDKDHIVEKGLPNVLRFVARILQCRHEDAALIFNGDVLLLTRFDGNLRKHRRHAWWDHYGFANDIVQG